MTEPTRFVDGLLSQVQDIAISQVRRLAPSFSRGVVTGVEPLSVRLDGQEGVLASAPESLVGGLAVGDVVYVVVYARRVVVLGRRGGALRVAGVGAWSGTQTSGTTPTALPLTLAPGSVGLTVSDGGLVVSRDGWYAVTGALWTAANENGYRSVNICVGGSYSGVGALWKPPSGISTTLPVSGLLLLSAGDVLTLRVWQSSGSALSASGRLYLNLVN